MKSESTSIMKLCSMEEYFAAEEKRRGCTPQELLPGVEKWSLGNGLKCAIFEVEREEKYDSAKRDKGDMLEEDADQKEEQENTEDEDENEDEYTSAFSGEFKQRAVFRVPPSP